MDIDGGDVRFVSGAVDVDVGEDVQGCVPVVGGVGGVSDRVRVGRAGSGRPGALSRDG